MSRGTLAFVTAVALWGGMAAGAAAQVRPTERRPPDRRPQPTQRVPADTVTDTAQVDLVRWVEPDSVEQAMLARRGFVGTRYQGNRVILDAPGRTLQLIGEPGAVSRGPTILVGDTIIYNDSTQLVVVRGDTNILRDPSQSAADVVSRGILTYDIARGRGAVTSISTAVTSGEQWFVQGAGGFFLRDTSGVQPTSFFVRRGSFTTCDDSIPDYHFRAREIKLISRNFIVARPATLYIGDVPIFWLPFVFQDIRSGRRSGILSPRFGVSDIVRNSPAYRRHVENLGYYFSFGDYADAQVWLDWRSGSRGTTEDPGWSKWNGQFRYRWLNRFLTGTLAASHLGDKEGNTNTAISWGHQQEFSQTRRFTVDLNYATNTRLQRRNTFNPQAVLATINSRVNYSQKLLGASLALGGSRRQYPGRTQVEQTFPNLSLTVPTVALGRWLEWTPNINFDNQQTLKLDQPGTVGFRYFTRPDGGIDSSVTRGDQRTTTGRFSTPLKIFGFTLTNDFSFNDREDNYPTAVIVSDPVDPTLKSTRTFERTYRTALDWTTGFSLPALFSGTWNLAPSISFTNVDPGPFWVRSQFTGGRWIHQSKRPNYSVGLSPTLFSLLPGIGPLARMRHSITPRISYSYSPRAEIDPEFLRATNRTAGDYLGANQQNIVQLNFSQVLEGKLREDTTAADDAGRKLRLLSLNFTPLAYDFERKRVTGRSGFITQNFGYDVASDLLPGFGLNVGYSLFQGSPLSDTAVFKPFRESISASFTINEQSAIGAALGRIFGRAVPRASTQLERLEPAPDDALAQRLAGTPVAGSLRRDRELGIPTTGGWQANIRFSSQRQRPPVGGNVIDFDPAENCRAFIDSPFTYDLCLLEQQTRPTTATPFDPVIGAPFVRLPPRETIQWTSSFHITPKWAAQWSTTYDLQARDFASQNVSLERKLHDWRSIFSFTKAANGNFAFMFYISLIAQPDLKFNYDQQTYRSATR